jgi:magnesium chelatase accessory protein
VSGRYPDWAVDGRDWPNREASRFVDAGGYRWHVQEAGDGPVCLLLHGTGAATHSWRDLLPMLSEHYRVIAVDLPGHGFTKTNVARKVTLEGMAQSVATLLDELKVRPGLIVGHSAGVAIGAQLLLDREWNLPLVGFTPALTPFPGLAARLFPSLAKVIFTNPFTGVILSRIASSAGETGKFLRRSTGSHIDAAGERYYARLFSKSGHCDGALRMMANWRLEPLRDRLGELAAPVLLVHASKDSAIKSADILQAAALIPGCETREMASLGHLAHEEDPALAASIIAEFAQRQLKR